ncbi:hypothetical protein KAR91_15400 [Candidatus Pacearchaeota archaeon]|nr:hypothetical protein [Candidatus Pacearchaeota archaeon]
MITTTALLTEFLVVGSLAWLWIIPLIGWFYSKTLVELLVLLGQAPPAHSVLIIFGTYVIGAFTESLSFAAEKIIVGSTSSPRSWYSKHVAQMSKSDWHAAQDRMWSSETAFKEFKQTHLRAGISRGGFINALFTMLSLLFVYLSGSWEKDLWPVFLIALFLLLVSPISWWFAHVEHTARVRIAGEILKEKSL